MAANINLMLAEYALVFCLALMSPNCLSDLYILPIATQTSHVNLNRYHPCSKVTMHLPHSITPKRRLAESPKLAMWGMNSFMWVSELIRHTGLAPHNGNIKGSLWCNALPQYRPLLGQ